MSFWKTIETEAAKLFGAVKKEIANPNVYQTAANDVHVLAPVVAGILTVEDPAIAPLVVPVATEVANDLVMVSAILKAAQANPQSSKLAMLGQYFDSMVSNLSGLLSAGHIKDPKLTGQITAMVDELGVIKSMVLPAAA